MSQSHDMIDRACLFHASCILDGWERSGSRRRRTRRGESTRRRSNARRSLPPALNMPWRPSGGPSRCHCGGEI